MWLKTDKGFLNLDQVRWLKLQEVGEENLMLVVVCPEEPEPVTLLQGSPDTLGHFLGAIAWAKTKPNDFWWPERLLKEFMEHLAWVAHAKERAKPTASSEPDPRRPGELREGPIKDLLRDLLNSSR